MYGYDLCVDRLHCRYPINIFPLQYKLCGHNNRKVPLSIMISSSCLFKIYYIKLFVSTEK